MDRHSPTPEAAKGDRATESVPKPEPHLQQFSGSPLRIVHLDLKGAAPKVKYLEQVRGQVMHVRQIRRESFLHVQGFILCTDHILTGINNVIYKAQPDLNTVTPFKC